MTKYKLPEDLYLYQKEDMEKISSNNALGSNWLNFSEMGVGKTPETLAVIEKNGYKCPLIVCPNSLRLEWKRQIEEWVGEGMTAVSSPDCYFRLEPIYRSFQEGQKYKIINYETLRNKRHLELLKPIPFDCIVFDEIHKLRNPKTKQVKGAWEFLDNLKNPNCKIIGLSGSPIMNYPNDLYVPLSVVHPSEYPRNIRNYSYFMYKYALWSDGKYGPYIYGTRRMGELREKTNPFTIRRTKKEVLPYLPDKYYRRSMLEMEPDQRKLYKQMEDELRILLDSGEPLWSTNVLTTLTRLRQINLDPRILNVSCSSAKTSYLIDLVEGTDEKLVIFSCFEGYIDLLSKRYLKDVPHVVITGKISLDRRAEAVRKFQNDDKIKLCLGTIQTMGEGITLTASSNCILTDRWWNAPTCSQAIDRLHRIGQKNSVQVIYPICEKSVDETLDQVLERKHELSKDYYQETEVVREVLSTL